MRKHKRASEGSNVCVESLETRTLMAADTVLTWNEVAVEATRVARLSPVVQNRALAMVQGAVFDAVNGIERGYAPYLVDRHTARWASSEASAATAAHDVLVGLFPTQQATLDTALASSLARVSDGRAEDFGVAFGKLVAANMLAERADDGSTDIVTYVPGTDPDDWQPTPPAFAPPLAPQYATLDPFVIDSPDQFRPAPPPAITSPEFTAAFNEVKAIGASNSATRTAEQTEIARYWAGPSGTVQPPGHWNRIAREVGEAQGNTLAQNARMLALLDIAMADAVIACWDAKYEYNYVRPITAIRNAANDGNPDTAADASWSSLLTTPAHPSYTSGHSSVSAAAATALAGFFGTDAIPFSDTAELTPGGAKVTRSFDGFWDAAQEAASSRLYAGIHWSFDNQVGLETGRKVGGFVLGHLFKRRGNSGHEGDFPGLAGEAPTHGTAAKAKSRSLFSNASDDDLWD